MAHKQRKITCLKIGSMITCMHVMRVLTLRQTMPKAADKAAANRVS
ncbi:hypothetical protein [Erysipelatoclostridium sp. DFI.2.3]|nr:MULTISPECIES: hypothetical protein [Thomasclavelia]EFR37242.1 hypothetical protein HMPREF9406_3284 [Clostridium sp. HGF2]EQJ59082.1 hypothetical protein QSI_1710 [Clostridioides difficile P28]MCR0185403.1 hypothetical protein [[Clostridium] innocuum]MCR0394210.1 hypothetical protein [[Clostridium] innocuum]MCR0398882.1 hypothetical protein [[Clostridium] innocuum]